MAILPVSGVNINSKNVQSFGARKKVSGEPDYVAPKSNSSNKLASVPVIVMLAMSPAMLNANSSGKAYPVDSEALTEVLASLPASEMEAAEFSYEPQATQQTDPLGVAFFRDKTIKKIVPAVGNGVKANLVLRGSTQNPNSKDVFDVFYIKHSYKDSSLGHRPPEVKELIYHDLGEDAFLGIRVHEYIYEKGKPTRFMISEIKLDDESAQYLLDLRTNDTEWNNKTTIMFSETKNPRVALPYVSD